MKTLNEELTDTLKSAGVSLVGFADLSEIDCESRDGFASGISVAIAINPRIISQITQGPTKLYYDEYLRVNTLLDDIGQMAEQFLRDKGYQAKFRAAKLHEDPDNLCAKLPHKTVATRAGLGWIGKCALLVTREYGSAIRFTSILTDAPLSPGKPVNISSCGECTECVDKCPANALSGMNWKAGVARDFLYNAFACQDTARDLSLKGFGVTITLCGRCIVTCPWTKKYIQRKP